MTSDIQGPLSAQVILRSVSGKAPDGSTQPTSENIRDFLPEPSEAASVRATFDALGFQVGPLVGNCFSVEGPAVRFEQVFHATLQRGEDGAPRAVDPSVGPQLELSVHGLPAPLRKAIAAVTFTPPPDFEPTRFGP